MTEAARAMFTQWIEKLFLAAMQRHTGHRLPRSNPLTRGRGEEFYTR